MGSRGALLLVVAACLPAVGCGGTESSPTDENPTGAATRNVFANDVLLAEVVPTPGSGTEPGLAFMVSSDGRVTP